MSAARELNGLAAAASAALAAGRAPSRWRGDAGRKSAGLASLRRASVWLDRLHSINPLMPGGPLWGDCLSQLVSQNSRTDAAASPHLSSSPHRTGHPSGGARRDSGETGWPTRAGAAGRGGQPPRPERPRHAPHSQAPPRPGLRAQSDFAHTDASAPDDPPGNHRRAYRDARRAEDDDARRAGLDVNELPSRADLPLLAHLHRRTDATRGAEWSPSPPSTSRARRPRAAAPSARDAHASADIQPPSRAAARWPLAPWIDRNARRGPVATHTPSPWPDARRDWQFEVSRRIARALNGGSPLAVASNAESQPPSQAPWFQAAWSQAQWSWPLAGPAASRDLLGRLAAMRQPEHTPRRDAAPRRESSAGTAHRNVESFDTSRHRRDDDRTNVEAGTQGDTGARRLASASFGAALSGPDERGAHSNPNGRAVYADAFPDLVAPTVASASAFSSLPPLLPPSAPDVAAPAVAAALARQGALSEALSPDEDLDALADKIKLILDEQARRHGIDV